MQTCNETVTLIRHSAGCGGDSYSPVVIRGASWHGGRTVGLIDNGAETHFSLSVRIPQQNMPAGILPAEGDLIARGELSGCDSLADITRQGAVRIMAVRDNCRGSLPHWRLLA